VGLATLPPSVSRMSENAGASISRNPKSLHGLYKDSFTFTLVFFTLPEILMLIFLRDESGYFKQNN
jgi:hypothetical protein